MVAAITKMTFSGMATPTTLTTTAATVHTNSGGAGILDEVWLHVANVGSSSVELTIIHNSGADSSTNALHVPSKQGLLLILPGLLLANIHIIKAQAAANSIRVVHGFVNSIVQL